MLNKRTLIEIVAERTGCIRLQVGQIVNTFINAIFEGTKEGHRIRVGGLGVFYPVLQSPRPVRNPRTQEPCMFESRYTLRFHAGADLIRKLNEDGGVNMENMTGEDD